MTYPNGKDFFDTLNSLQSQINQQRSYKLLLNKVVVITRGHKNLGRVISLQMAKEQAKIAILCSMEEMDQAEEVKCILSEASFSPELLLLVLTYNKSLSQ